MCNQNITFTGTACFNSYCAKKNCGRKIELLTCGALKAVFDRWRAIIVRAIAIHRRANVMGWCHGRTDFCAVSDVNKEGV